MMCDKHLTGFIYSHVSLNLSDTLTVFSWPWSINCHFEVCDVDHSPVHMCIQAVCQMSMMTHTAAASPSGWQ